MLWRTVFSLNLGKCYAITNMKEQLPFQYSVGSLKAIMVSDFWHHSRRKLVTVLSFLAAHLPPPSLSYGLHVQVGANTKPNCDNCVLFSLNSSLSHLLRTALINSESRVLFSRHGLLHVKVQTFSSRPGEHFVLQTSSCIHHSYTMNWGPTGRLSHKC